MVYVKAKVEFYKNKPFNMIYNGRGGEGRGQWDDLKGVTWLGDYVKLPIDQFANGTKVPDVVCANWNGGVPNWVQVGDLHPKPRAGAIVISLESPHEDEYDYEENQFLPKEPLRDKASRTRLRCQLIRLVLAAANAKEIELQKDVDVILRNPIQFQTSLHRLIPLDQNGKKGRLRSEIRNATWRELWNYTKGGVYPFRDDFLSRLNEPGPPCLIINACTKALRDNLIDFFNKNPKLPVINVNNHPSFWNCYTEILLNDK